MPFKSKAQIEWGKRQVKSGKWPQSVFDEWMSKTPKNLPDHVPSRTSKTPKIGKVKVIK